MDFFSPPPTPPNSGNPGTFNDDADAFLGWFPAFVAELNALLPYLTGAGFSDGTAAAPGLVWKGDPDTGLFRPGSNALGIAAGGVLRLTVSALALTSTVPLRAPLGTAAAPGIAFEADPNTGIRSDGADVLHFVTGGATRGFFSTTHFQSTLPAVVPVGAAAAPGPHLRGRPRHRDLPGGGGPARDRGRGRGTVPRRLRPRGGAGSLQRSGRDADLPRPHLQRGGGLEHRLLPRGRERDRRHLSGGRSGHGSRRPAWSCRGFSPAPP